MPLSIGLAHQADEMEANLRTVNQNLEVLVGSLLA